MLVFVVFCGSLASMVDILLLYKYNPEIKIKSDNISRKTNCNHHRTILQCYHCAAESEGICICAFFGVPEPLFPGLYPFTGIVLHHMQVMTIPKRKCILSQRHIHVLWHYSKRVVVSNYLGLYTAPFAAGISGTCLHAIYRLVSRAFADMAAINFL